MLARTKIHSKRGVQGLNKATKLLGLGVTLIMCIGLFAGCGGNKNFVVGYNKMGSFGSKEISDSEITYTLEVVDSSQTLKDLCDEWGNPAFQESSELYTNELSQKIRSYNEVFFSDKILVVYSFQRGHSKETQIVGIEVEGAKLIINARYVTKKGTFTDEAFNWIMLIEINKSDATGVTTAQIKYK